MLRPTTAMDEEEEGWAEVGRPSWHARARGWVFRNPKDAVAVVVALAGVGIIAVNALFMQSGPHPAPLFSLRSIGSRSAAVPHREAIPRPRPTAPETTAAAPAAPVPPRSRTEIVSDIQRALAQRGLYKGDVDGKYGPKTEAAVRDFVQHAHIKIEAEPSEALLRALTQPANALASLPTGSSAHAHADPIAALINPPSRIEAVQRVLADYGYGQIKPNGVVGPETVAAIEKFERSRGLPATGRVTDRLVRELAAMTGKPLD